LLDIACGAGYGSFLIGKNFPNSSVIGGDYDERAISYAKNNYRLANLQFAKANIVTWSYENITNIDQQNNEESLGKFDVILCFDTIEHLLHRETALKNLTENLADDGFLLLSTPCGHKETLLNPGWEHHKIEYSSTDLFDFLSRHFAEVLRPEDGNLPAMDFWLNVINKDKIRYLNKTNPVCCRKPIKIRS
ncbi:MAG: class I SAM-dependent methyltransferase, partial [Cyanobacteria bacterium J083]